MCEYFDWKLIEIIIAALTAIGTLAVAVLAIWGDWFRAKFAPGKLTIEIHNHAGDLTHLTLPNGGLMHTYFFHLKIVNKRHWISPKNCRVLLQAMSKRGPDNEFHPIPMAVPLQFVWAPAEITPPVVTIHHKQIIDFGIMTEVEKSSLRSFILTVIIFAVSLPPVKLFVIRSKLYLMPMSLKNIRSLKSPLMACGVQIQ